MSNGNTKNTINDLLARLSVDVDNMNSFLYSLQKMLDSKSENVTITQTLDDGSTTSINVPSYGYLKGKIDALSTNFETLISANEDVIGIKSANGDVRKFELKKVSKLIQELEQVSKSSFTLPTSFGIKNNWFFESFLNPLLFVSIDVSSILTEDMDQFSVKRIIINSIDDDELAYFDDTYLKANDINLTTLKNDLHDRGIDYFEDDNVVDMDVAVNRFRGSFDVYRILEEQVDTVVSSTGETVTVYRNRYKLNTLNYTDILDGTKNTKILAEGNTLITDNDSEYKVLSVNKTDREVVLERTFGIDPITIGADVLRLKPVKYRVPELKINVGYNEREIVFVKPVSKSNNLTIDEYSNGFGVYTNNLTITLEDGSTATLEQYYNNFVSDFGMILMSLAKEKKLPSILAEKPSAPILDATNFKVTQVDQHIKEDEDDAEIRNQIAEKENLKIKIKENLKKIDELKAQLNDTQRTESEKNRIDKKIQESIKEKSYLQSQLSSVIKNLTDKLSTTPAFNRSPIFKVRGFWPIPMAKTTKYGYQEVVQFKVRYRYLSKKGTAPNAEQSTITQEDGTKSFATFSPWTEQLTKPRTKSLNETTGLYQWDVEDVSNAESVNINQLDISIRKGESIEIQIKSISEAGWPENPVESDWSESVIVPFPEDIQSAEESTIISQRIFAEEARLDFEDELTSRGLDLHLANQFTTGERFFAHNTKDIASGFFTSEGNIIDLFEKIKTMQATIDSLQQAIAQAKGVIKVSIIDDLGNTSEIKPGDTVKLFAGYYRDLIRNTSGLTITYEDGKIITKQYIISIQNTSSTPLELIALMQGGIDQSMPISDPVVNPTIDYHVNRRYDLATIGINTGSDGTKGGTLYKSPYQSSQVMSQMIASRYKDYGLTNNLYAYDNLVSSTSYAADASIGLTNVYQGILISSKRVPYHSGHYVPFEFDWDGGTTFSTDINIWNGETNTSKVPQPNGYLNEFCMHIDHPYLKTLGANKDCTKETLDRRNYFSPYNTGSSVQSYMPVCHAAFFETSVDEVTGILGNAHYAQANCRIPQATNSTVNFSNFPIKLGFTPEDEWLVGKYTCGSYLYMFPNSYSDISVDGNHPALSSKKIEGGIQNSLNISVIFQFRASDKLGYIGGFRTDDTLKNIKYKKKIGIDIFVKNDNTFSFDIEVTGQYKKETTIDAPIVPSRGTTSISF